MRAPQAGSRAGRPRGVRRIALRALYWLAVLAVAVAILVALVLFLESRDTSSVSGGTVVAAPLA